MNWVNDHGLDVSTRRAAFILVALLTATSCSSAGKITLDSRSSSTSPTSSSGPSTSRPKSSTTTPDQGAGTETIKWRSCDSFDIDVSSDMRDMIKQSDMTCGNLTVPIQHSKPDGPTIDIAVAKIPASGKPSERVGSLILNPGGPGGSGLQFLASATFAIPPEMSARFDLVSFDPRGVAASSPVNCLSEKQREAIIDAETPTDPAEQVAAAIATEQQIADGCAKAPNDLEQHMGTDEVASDLDAIRAAVGDEKLTYLGLSYGTRIGAAYATMFPDRVRALVLDGSVTPSRDLVDASAGQIRGIGRALESFVSRCDASADCPLAPDAMQRIDAAAEKLDATPMKVPATKSTSSKSEESLDKDKFITGLITALYDPSVFDATALAIDALDGTDSARATTGAQFLLGLAGQQDSKREDGTYGNGFETQMIVNCLDADSPLDTAELPVVRQKAGTIPALLDEDPTADSPDCTKLATGDALRIAPNAATPKTLIVGTVGDPATPIEWTDALAAALGKPAVLRYGGNGHTASLRIECVTDQVVAFLNDAKVPPSLVDCKQDQSEFDIYKVVGEQFETIGMDGACIVDGVRSKLDPLDIVSLNSDTPPTRVVSALQAAAMKCR